MEDNNFFFRKASKSVFDAVSARRRVVGSTEGAVRKTGYVEIYAANPVKWQIPMAPLEPVPAESSKGPVTDTNTNKTLLGSTPAQQTQTVNTYYKILPVVGTSLADTYSGKTSKPVPTLGQVTIEMDGEFGSLRRATAEFTCYDMDSFNQIEKAILRPGERVFIRYGYLGENTASETCQGSFKLDSTKNAYEFVIYDYSFTFTKENYIKCSFKAVGPGVLAGSVNFGNTVVPGNREFLRNFEEKETKTPVKGIEDVFDYNLYSNLLKNSNKVDSIGNGAHIAVPSEDGYDDTVKSVICMMKLPTDYNVADAIQDTNWSNSSYIAYCTLGYLVHTLINTELFKNSDTLAPEFKKIRYVCNKEVSSTTIYNNYIFSADPLNVAITSKDGKQMSYGPPGPPDMTFSLFNTAIHTNPDFLALQGNSLDCSNILISRYLLRSILKKFSKDKFSVNDFLSKLFEAISDATAGIVTLGAYEPDLNSMDDDEKKLYDKYSKNGNYTPILIKHLKQKPNNIPEAVKFDPLQGDGITRSCEVTAKVPKDMAAEAFGRNAPGQTGGSTGTDGGQISQVLNNKKSLIIKYLPDNIFKPLKETTYPENKLSGVAVEDGKAFLKDLTNKHTTLEDRLKSEQIPYPLEMKLTLDGIEGFRFGDHVTTTNLPAVYQQKSGMRVGFTVLRTTHTISGNDWRTELTTIARMING